MCHIALKYFFWFCMFFWPHIPSQESHWLDSMCAPLHLKFPAFKGVTRGMSFKHISPSPCYPWYMQVWPGVWSKPIIWETWEQVPQSRLHGVAIIYRRNKRVLNFVQQVSFLLSTEGSLVISRAYPALYLSGTPSQETGTSPPSCLLLENRLYILQLDNKYCVFKFCQSILGYQIESDSNTNGGIGQSSWAFNWSKEMQIFRWNSKVCFYNTNPDPGLRFGFRRIYFNCEIYLK